MNETFVEQIGTLVEPKSIGEMLNDIKPIGRHNPSTKRQIGNGKAQSVHAIGEMLSGLDTLPKGSANPLLIASILRLAKLDGQSLEGDLEFGRFIHEFKHKWSDGRRLDNLNATLAMQKLPTDDPNYAKLTDIGKLAYALTGQRCQRARRCCRQLDRALANFQS